MHIPVDPTATSFDTNTWANSKTNINSAVKPIPDQNGTGNEAGGTTEKILEDIQKSLDALTSGPNSRVLDNEWKQLSMIFDRLLFFVFLVINVLVTLILYSRRHTRFSDNDLDELVYMYY